jgi:tetratricopeptide (TPR) repeat protein
MGDPRSQPSDLDTSVATDHFRMGNYQEALRRADAILAAGPHVALSWRFKGECLFEMERYAEAIACFDKAVELGGPGTEELFIWKALALHGSGELEEAEALLAQYIADTGKHPPQLVLKAQGILTELQNAS